MKKLPEDFHYLRAMYGDGYFPRAQVDKLRDVIKETVAFIEQGGRSNVEIQAEFDRMTEKINELQTEFLEHDSEIETVARESIGSTVGDILQFFEIEIDPEDAIGNRDW